MVEITPINNPVEYCKSDRRTRQGIFHKGRFILVELITLPKNNVINELFLK